jgi:hypothetical protein
VKTNISLLFIVVFVLFCIPSAFALDTLGPPVAQLEKGHFSAGADYSYSDIDLIGKGKSTITVYDFVMGRINKVITYKERQKFKDVDIQKIYTTFGYGITDDWEGFLRLGGANANLQDNGNTNFAFGFGTRLTLYKADRLEVGAIAQCSWAKSEHNSIETPYELDIIQIRTYRQLSWQDTEIMIGANYKMTEYFSIYGGPFIQFTDGNLNIKRGPVPATIPEDEIYYHNSYDIEEVSNFGGYIGAGINITGNISYNIEYQHTVTDDALGMSLIWRF